MEYFFATQFIRVLLILSVPLLLAKQLFTAENDELVKIIKEEMDQFRVDMTKSFMETHSRRKRAQSELMSDIDVNNDGPFWETPMQFVGPFSTFTFDGTPFLIRRNGIFRIENLSSLSTSMNTLNDNRKNLTRVGSWTLKSNEVVLDGLEWKRNFFILTTTGNFTTIYTMHANSLQPVYRQRIQNRGNAVAAQFFEYRRNLYLTICNDNEHHSATFSAIYWWAGSYMDEIHQIQTTGASAVKAFTINSKKYIAIAQSQDSSGNMMLGTVILCMDHQERLEKVQLLWSHGARSLHYMSTAKEHFLLIGQEKESSIVYWFGGMDFIYWQQFEGLQGKELVMDGLQVTEDEPIVLASDGNSLRLFSRSASATKIMTSWVQSRIVNIASDSPDHKITQAKFLSLSQNEVYLAVTKKMLDSESELLRVYPVNFVKRQLAVSRTKESRDKLTPCLQSLSTSLKEAQPILAKLEFEGPNVLTTDGNWDFQGILESEKVIKLDSSKSKVQSAQITPEMIRAGSSDRIRTSPSQLLSTIQESSDHLELLKLQLDNVFYKSKSNEVTGNLTFLNTVQFETLQCSGSDMRVQTINNVKWSDIHSSTLKLTSTQPQRVTSAWTMESLRADKIFVFDTTSKLSPDTFLQKSCTTSEMQRVTGAQLFQENVKLTKSIEVKPTTFINGIQFENVALKQNKHKEIQGFKHVPFVEGNYIPQRVNDVHLPSWFTTMAKINSQDVQKFTGPVKISENAAVYADRVSVMTLNSKEWNQFTSNVLTDGLDQTIRGSVGFENLRVEHLASPSISSVKSENLLTSDASQQIVSQLTVENVQINGTLVTQQINGLHLSDAVSRHAKEVEISGPVVLKNCQVKDIFVPERVTIAGRDVSELVMRKKVHMYSTADGNPLSLKGNVVVNNLAADSINKISVADFETRFWSKTGNNTVNPAQLVLSKRLISVLNENFQTHTVNGLNFPADFVLLNQASIKLNPSLHFNKAVTVEGNVTMVDGKTIEKIDMSRVQSMIVDDKFHGMVRGKKTFTFPIVTTHGAFFQTLNGMDPIGDVVMLNSRKEQRMEGSVTFERDVETNEVHAHGGDVDILGFVNDINLEKLKTTTAYKDKENLIEGDVIFNHEIKADKFSSDILNNLNIKEITDNMVLLSNAESQVIEGGIIVTDGTAQFFDDSMTHQINGIPVNQFLSQVVSVGQTPNGIIKGKKTFTNAKLNNELHCSTFNGVQLLDLERNAFSKSHAQVVDKRWSFGNVHFKKNLETQEIGGIFLDNLVSTNEPMDISSIVNFTSSRTRIEGPLEVRGHLNGIKFDQDMRKSVNLDGARNFDSVTIHGNLVWEQNLHEMQRLSYLFENAVLHNKPQTITGSVKFSEGFAASEIESANQWLSGIDLQTIQNDALIKSGAKWVISGNNKFSKSLKIKNLDKPVSEIDVNAIDNVSLQTIQNDIVKVTDLHTGKMIKGTKAINGKLNVHDVTIFDKISDFAINDFVVKDDERELEKISFKDILVSENLDMKFTSGFDLQSLLNDRVSLKNSQELRGSYTFDKITTNKCDAAMINEVTIRNVVRPGSQALTLSGKKVFKNGLTVEGEFNTPAMNDHSLHDLFESTLHMNRKETINRHFIFESPVIINQPMKVNSVNEINLHSFSEQVANRIGKSVSDARSPESLVNVLASQSAILERISEERSVWFDYMRMKQDWTSLGAKSKVDHIKRSKTGDVLVTLHHKSDGQSAELPKGCMCGTTVTLKLDQVSPEKTQIVGVDNCLQVFHVTSSTGRVYTVTSETPSSNITCISQSDKTTKIFTDHEFVGELTMGHVSDVGVFTDLGRDYLVLAEYFNKESQSHSTATQVVRIEPDGTIKTVQAIETHGAKKVAISLVNDSWMLAVANNKNNIDETSCHADSAIYAWSPMDEEFFLLRTIMTDGAFDVKFLTATASSKIYEQSFVAFAQEGNPTNGEVMIYKYEQLGRNFLPSQTIRSDCPLMALESTCMCHQCFMITVAPQKGITFYENRFVEGFQEYYRAPVFGAMDISSFTINNEHMFAIATNKGPILAEAVLAGTCPPT